MPVTTEFDLPANKTYAVRFGYFARYTHDGFPVAGILQLTELRKLGGKEYVRRYAVQELVTKRRGEERVFKLTKPLGSAKEGEDEAHHVSFDGKWMTCTCKGYTRQHWCAHAECLTVLRNKKAFPVCHKPKEVVS